VNSERSAVDKNPSQATEPAKTSSPGAIGDASLMDASAVAAALDVDVESGLSAAQAALRLKQNGPNELRAAPRVAAWRRALAHFQDPLTYLLLVAAAIALLAWWVEGRVGWPVDAIVIAAVVLLNGVISQVQEAKAQNAVAALAKMTAVTSAVLRDGKEQRLPSAELVCGDVIVLAEGDAVGADARLLAATTLRVQEASLTGESEGVLKAIATQPKPAPLADQRNMVFKGTAVGRAPAVPWSPRPAWPRKWDGLRRCWTPQPPSPRRLKRKWHALVARWDWRLWPLLWWWWARSC